MHIWIVWTSHHLFKSYASLSIDHWYRFSELPFFLIEMGNLSLIVQNMNYSDQDIAILREMQRDASLSLAALSQKVSVAQSTLWRKLQDFEASGLIKGRVALLDPSLAGCKLCVLASVSLHDHTEEAVTAFTNLVFRHREIMECHAISGTADYSIKVRVEDVEAYERFMTHTLLRNPFVRSVVSSFSLREIKSSTELPL